MKNFKHINRSKGFTLLEISVVLAIIGLLSVFLASRFIAKQDDAKASNMLRLADSARDALAKYDLECGTGTAVASNTLIANGKQIEDAIFAGDSNINTNYLSPTSNCADRAGVKPMTDLAKKSGTGYALSGMPVTLTDAANGYTGTVFKTVAKSVLEALLSKVSDSATVNAAGDTTGNRVQYSANGTKFDVTILSK